MSISPDDALALTKPCKSFLCPLNANVFNIDFLSFEIKDYETKRVIFEVNKDAAASALPADFDFSMLDESVYRKIKYDFSVDVLRLPNIQTVLEFSNGEREVERFRMIERHYFRDRLVKSFDFKFGFVPPNTRNSWDVIYDVPLLDDDLVSEMLEAPYETRSDSFYFVDGKLIMHNMAEYRYTENSIEAQGKANAETGLDVPVTTGSSGAGSKTSSGSGGQKSSSGSGGCKFDDEEEDDSGAGSKFSYK